MEGENPLPSSEQDPKTEGVDKEPESASGSTGIDIDSPQMVVLQSPKTSLVLLPEIWEQIFRRLNPTDFMRISGLCPEWNQLLKPYMAKKLISQVLAFGVEGGISREVLLKCSDLNEETSLVVNQALRRRLQQLQVENEQHRVELEQHRLEYEQQRQQLAELIQQRDQLRRDI